MEHEIAKQGEILLYSDSGEKEYVSVVFRDDTFWLTQKAMAELFDCTADNISLHLKNIFADGELDKNSVTEKFSATAADGKGHISRETAAKKVGVIYEEFRKKQDAEYISEFDRQTEKYLKGE